MNDLCADIGYKSINHFGEQLCGDHVDIVEPGDGSTVVVLSDGLGSGVKASILSTLTSKIISTMLSEGLSLEECVETIAATLPVCSIRGVAYSTFTIIHLKNNQSAELIQHDNKKGHCTQYFDKFGNHVPTLMFTYYLFFSCSFNAIPFAVRRYFCFGWFGLSGYTISTKPSTIAGKIVCFLKYHLDLYTNLYTNLYTSKISSIDNSLLSILLIRLITCTLGCTLELSLAWS